MGKRMLGSGYRRSTAILALAAMVVGLVAYLWPGTLMDRFEWRTVDWRFHARGALTPHPGIAIMEVDEASLRELGQWPWPRARLAELIDRLHDAGARAIVLDIFIVEPSREGPADDEKLVRAVARCGNVYLASFGVPLAQAAGLKRSSKSSYAWERARIVPGRGLDALAGLHEFAALQRPLPALATAARGLGYIDVAGSEGRAPGQSAEDVYRMAPPVGTCGKRLYPALALAVVAGLTGTKPDQVTVTLGKQVQLGPGHFIPLDRDGNAALNFVGPDRTFPYLSARQVLSPTTKLDRQVKDKIVLVGATAPGLYDLRPTPFGNVFYGVEVQATMLDNVLFNRFLRYYRPEQTTLLIILVSLCMGLAFCLLRPLYAAGLGVALLWGFNEAALWLFRHGGLVVPMVAPTMTGLLALFSLLTYRVLAEERRSSRLHEMFAHFAPPQVVQELEREGAGATLFGQRRNITVLFSDLRNFSQITEHTAPEDLVRMLNRYFTLMHEVIWEYEGTVDKFVGDGLMALFNAPLAREDHQAMAVRCALEMQRRIHALRDEWAFYGIADLRAGIGLASGEAVVGCMGSPGRQQYTAIGATVNLAARLEELTKEQGAEIIVSQEVWAAVQHLVEGEPLPPAHLQGFEKPVQAYRLKSG